MGEFVPEVQKLGIKVFYLPQKKGTDYFSFLKVVKILKREKIDVIHTHNETFAQPAKNCQKDFYYQGQKQLLRFFNPT